MKRRNKVVYIILSIITVDKFKLYIALFKSNFILLDFCLLLSELKLLLAWIYKKVNTVVRGSREAKRIQNRIA